MIKWHVLIIFLITALAFSGLIMIVVNFDPYISGLFIKFLFFASFIMTIVGLILSIFALIKKETEPSKEVQPPVSQ